MENKTIVLDAGHGLMTPGKRTPNGIFGIVNEWTLNASVVNYITDILKDYNVDIFYSYDRTGKNDTPLQQRVQAINKLNPDLMISIHHNAFMGTFTNVTGVETYYHTNGTKTDEQLAKLMQSYLVTSTRLRNRGIKHSNFTILSVNAQIPAILVEGGFMDGKSDYLFICTPEGQRAYAKAVSECIIEFLNLKQINHSSASAHQVIKGDTLWSLSIKYGISVDSIKRANNLINDKIFINDMLIIPANNSYYTVQPGDTLWSISRKFNTTVNALKYANELKSDLITLGQVLLII